ncbi:hypothetical protein JW868_04155 [Candidatus Woesearchaeota archaeon]|nr:hypothetical protein [Candidatus Woesearchaeota archaeon]
MKQAIICSTKDLASINIRDRMLELYDFKETGKTFDGYPIVERFHARIFTTDRELITLEDIDKEISADIFIFASKHISKSRIPSLSLHAVGNFCSPAELGGQPLKLGVAPARLIRFGLDQLLKLKGRIGFDVMQEATHHGPLLNKPALFIEIGSDSLFWKDREAGMIIAKAIHRMLRKRIPNYSVAFGIGGLHSTPNFMRIMEEYHVAFGHVCAKYNLNHLNGELVQQALSRTEEKVDFIVLDWKGLGSEKEKVKSILKDVQIPVVRSDQFSEWAKNNL